MIIFGAVNGFSQLPASLECVGNNKSETSSNVTEDIRAVLIFFFFHEKILQAQKNTKSTKKHKKHNMRIRE